MLPVHLRDLGFQRNQPEDREGLSRTRRPGRGHLGHSGGWQNNEGDNINPSINTPIQQEPQTRGLEGYGSSSSAPPTLQRFISMEHGQQEVQPSISLGRTWRKLSEDLSPADRLQGPYGHHQRRVTDPDREYSDSIRLTRSRPNQLSSDFTQFRNQQISGQQSPFFTIPGGFQEKTRIQGEKQDLFQSKEESVRPNDPEVVEFGERSAQDPEVVVNHSKISSPINRTITPTQIEHNSVSPQINLKSDALWLQMSQYAEQTQKQFAELEASHERMKESTPSMDKIVKTLQEGRAQLRKASEETNKRLNIVFEEQHHSRRDTDYLDQDINKLFNVYHNIKPQPQGHVMDNPFHPDHIKPDVMKSTNIWKFTPHKSSGYKEKQPSRVQFKDKPKEKVAELAKKRNSCHNCGSTDHYANNCPKENKKVYAIEKVPEEESSTEDSESDSMGNAIREPSDGD
ncbi:hypothetical protein O181_006813 [Austropuccinia psidii MF-1]|uniref:CCHC-type domain-containing protein n=1 Tax=Austropuccinia psidii MF-1 TaxID=1389203 RepID=A0A9Q3BL67_9BASI|nr:hypothetical protein [Austropuccinia psidii MF-1]